MAITEAMAVGLPVVITRECNFDEVERFDTGIVVDHGDMEAFTGAVARLLGDDGGRRAKGQNGWKLVRQEFTVDATAQKLEKLYESLVRNTGIPESLRPRNSRKGNKAR